MTGKIAVTDFDQTACEGCPHRTEQGESTENGLVDALADIEAGVLTGATGDEQHKCGLCGCPLANLDLFNRAPGDCPRLVQHGVDK